MLNSNARNLKTVLYNYFRHKKLKVHAITIVTILNLCLNLNVGDLKTDFVFSGLKKAWKLMVTDFLFLLLISSIVVLKYNNIVNQVLRPVHNTTLINALR